MHNRTDGESPVASFDAGPAPATLPQPVSQGEPKMIRHDPVLPPEFIYPIDDWRWVERRFTPEFMAASETTFSTANGYLGMRGGFQEGRPSFLHGTFVNGFYETWPIPYGEKAFGFAKTGQTMVNVPDGKIIRLYVDDEPFTMDRANLLRYERALDMRRGVYQREVLWETPSGKQVLIKSTRLVSFAERHVAAIRYEVTVLNAKAPVVVVSEMVNHAAIIDTTRSEAAGGLGVAAPVDEDPRLAKSFKEQVLVNERTDVAGLRVLMGFHTRSSRMSLGCGMDHVVESENTYTNSSACPEHCGQVVFSVDAEPGKPFRLYKYLAYHTSHSEQPVEMRARSGRTLDRAVRHGYDALASDQRTFMDGFWRDSDIEVAGPSTPPRLQQCIRWNLFQLLQATGRVENAGVPAKGLTGQAYEGHYFWDMEIYVMPFLIYTAPRTARNLLIFRHGMLEQARQRARDLNQRGALFPWRTISGEEASAYYAAGTAQYHINAAIAFAMKKYVDVTDDQEFLREYGAEVLVETARLWYDLGFFSDRVGGKFCIHSVTGPDEYSTVVNNNTYTNLMARENLWYAADVVDGLRARRPVLPAAIPGAGDRRRPCHRGRAPAPIRPEPADRPSGPRPARLSRRWVCLRAGQAPSEGRARPAMVHSATAPRTRPGLGVRPASRPGGSPRPPPHRQVSRSHHRSTPACPSRSASTWGRPMSSCSSAGGASSSTNRPWWPSRRRTARSRRWASRPATCSVASRARPSKSSVRCGTG